MAYADEVTGDGATTYFRLGESSGTTADDAVGSDDHTYQGSPTLGATGLVSGADTAVTLNGTSQYVDKASPSSNLDLGDTFTVELWLKRGRSGVQEDLWGRNWSGGQIVRITSDNKITLRKSGIANIVQSTATITDTSPHHVVVTKSGSTVKIYIDGTDVTGTVSNQTFGVVSGASVIGRDAGGSSGYFKGTLDEVAFYKGTALTSTQVGDHYTAGVGTTTHNATGTLTGSGSVTASARATYRSTTGTLTGSGTATAAASRKTFATATLSGSGAPTATASRKTFATATLAGSGSLTGAASRTARVTGTLSAAGSVAATAGRTVRVTGTLTASGALSGAANRRTFATGTLSGSATPAATARQTHKPSATLSASGTLSADAVVEGGATTYFATGTLTGTGSLTGTARLTHRITATLSGTGSLTGTPTRIAIVTGSLTGIGSLTGSARQTHKPQGTLTGTGLITASVIRTAYATATLSGEATLDAIWGIYARRATLSLSTASIAAQLATRATSVGVGTGAIEIDLEDG